MNILWVLMSLTGLLYLTSCCEPYKEKTISKTQYIEDSMSIVDRKDFRYFVFNNINLHTDETGFYEILDDGSKDYSPFGFSSLIKESDGWNEPLNLPNNYGKEFYADISIKQDLFLAINISRDKINREKYKTIYGRTTLGFCNNSRDGTYDPVIYKNINSTISDNLKHFTTYYSIPILISKGKITKPGTQVPLCIKTWGS